MRSLFRAFESDRVRYLVISGQASVLYGAAHFTQDLDLWVDPSPENLKAMLQSLARLRALVHKLTPPVTPRFARRGHGFHFVVPMPREDPLYVDVMGRPPRVDTFAAASKRTSRFPTPWGTLPVVSIEDLIELKKTNRPADYEVITGLVLIRLDQELRPSPALLRWAVANVFRVEDLWSVIESHADRMKGSLPPAARLLDRIRRQGRKPTLAEFSRAAALLAREASRLQDAGRAYWLPLIDELRELRARGKLIPVGTPVAELLR